MDPAKRKKSAPKKPRAKKSDPKADAAVKTKRATKGTKAVKQPEPVSDPNEQTRKLPGKQFVKTLAKDVLIQMERSSTAGGLAGQMISDASKKKGLPARAFKDSLKLLRMGRRDPVALRTYIDDMRYMAECFELEKLAGESLFEAREGAEEIEEDEGPGEGEGADEIDDTVYDEEGDEERPDEDNIHRLGQGRAA